MALEQVLSASLAVEKQMYLALSEVLDLTRELLDSLQRQDQVSVRLNLSLRQESVDQLNACRDALKRQVASLPPREQAALRGLLNGESSGDSPSARALAQQVERNQALWTRVVQADQSVSRRMGGEHSYYQRQRQK